MKVKGLIGLLCAALLAGSAFSPVHAEGEQAYPSAYSMQELGLVTPVREQKDADLCWAFAAVACMENNALLHGLADQTLDLSEAQLAYAVYNNPQSPAAGLEGDRVSYLHEEKPWYSLGGDNAFAMTTLLKGYGPVMEADAPYAGIADALSENVAFHTRAFAVRDVYTYSGADRDGLKDAIMKFGGVTMRVRMEGTEVFAGKSDSLYIASSELTPDHEVCIVGWDDTYSKENFKGDKPSGDGAWLCKNSYGEKGDLKGYFWLSYEDAVSNSDANTCYAFDLTTTSQERETYQYDGGGSVVWKTVKAGANVYTARKTQRLTGIQVLNREDAVAATLTVYSDVDSANPTSGLQKCTQEVFFPKAGYTTVELKTPVLLAKGQKFSVCLNYKMPTQVGIDTDIYHATAFLSYDVTANPGESFFVTDGAEEWRDLTSLAEVDGKDRTLRLKAIAEPWQGNGEQKLNAPELEAEFEKEDTIWLNWSAVDKAEGYLLYGAAQGEEPVYLAEFECDEDEYEYEFRDAKPDKSYEFYLVAFANGYDLTESARVQVGFLLPPTGFSINQKDNGVVLRWNKVKTANQYVIYRKTNNGNYKKIAVTGNVRSYTDVSVIKGFTYFYRIRAKRDALLSDYSSHRKIRVR
ncbi:MAG: hypothetical protein E7280_10045 [Lachnospiraceae bacterium]|nr:hypothetical protein [Lachnospiraceae bacterium]